MNINFMKSLIISFGFHAFAISLFFIDGKKFKKSETSMTEIIILSATENNNIKKKKTDTHEIIKKGDLRDKTTENKNLTSSVENNENEFYKVSNASLTSNNKKKKKTDNSFLENRSFKNPDNTKNPSNYEISKFSENQNTKSIFASSATYKIGSAKNPHPTYPLIARKKGWEGRVLIQAEIDRVGNVSEVKVLESSGYKVLDNASLETLKEWKFTPAKIGNKFVDDTVNIPVKFLLTN
jgi:TonB family protein